MTSKPTLRPTSPLFSAGPCKKYTGWSVQALADAPVGRSHRSKAGKAKLKLAIDETRAILGVPDDYRIAIVPASDTGAVEMAMWSMLGPRPVDVFAWESFSKDWVTDAVEQLKLDANVYVTDYGILPDMTQAKPENDCVFCWNGTTAGVKVPNADWIADDRQGLTICDATSAIFAMDLPWEKLDVTTYSWQKVLGSEAAHGILILSPRAVERLESYTPDRPLPKLFRMTKGGKLIEGIFQGETINTPSMLSVEDALSAMKWVKSIGGLPAMIARSEANLDVVADWVKQTDWIDFLAQEPEQLSCTSICLKFVDPWFTNQAEAAQRALIKDLCSLLESEEVAYDINAYRAAPPGLRIWGGGTVETQDIQALLPWIGWAYAAVRASKQDAA